MSPRAMPFMANTNFSITDNNNNSIIVTDGGQIALNTTVQSDMGSSPSLNSTAAENETVTIPNWLLYTYCGLLSFGVVSNIINLMVMSKLKISIMYIYLKWIAFFELCFCIFLMPGIVMLYIGRTTSYIFAFLNTFVSLPMSLVSSSCSMLLTVVIGYDRVYHIKFPLRAHASATKTRARIKVVTVLVICCLVRLPFVAHMDIVPHATTDGQVMYRGTLVGWSQISNVVQIFIMALVFDYICPISLAVCSIMILYDKKKIEIQRKNLSASEDDNEYSQVAETEQARKLTMVLVTMSLMNITCNVPVTLLRMIWPTAANHFLWKNISNVLYITNHICNVFIYTAMDKTYWNQFTSLLMPCRRQHEINNSEQQNTGSAGRINNKSSTSVATVSL